MFTLMRTTPNLSDLDQKRISEILGSTMRPVGPGGPLTEYMRMRAESSAKKKKKPKRKAKAAPKKGKKK